MWGKKENTCIVCKGKGIIRDGARFSVKGAAIGASSGGGVSMFDATAQYKQCPRCKGIGGGVFPQSLSPLHSEMAWMLDAEQQLDLLQLEMLGLEQ